MKSIKQYAVRILMAVMLCCVSMLSFGQGGDPPPPPSQHGSGQDEIPGGATPVESGLLITLFLGGIYGVKRFRDFKHLSE